MSETKIIRSIYRERIPCDTNITIEAEVGGYVDHVTIQVECSNVQLLFSFSDQEAREFGAALINAADAIGVETLKELLC